MSQKRFARVGDILPAVLKSIGLDQKLREREILACWAEVVGEEIAARTRAIKIDRGVLFVHVDHSAWMQELHFMEREIIERLNEKKPGITVRKIRFGTGK
jgi:predicted nucleic acid-binding Zn ribbon protein